MNPIYVIQNRTMNCGKIQIEFYYPSLNWEITKGVPGRRLTIKRQWGFSYIMTKKSSKRASADTSFSERKLGDLLLYSPLIGYL